MWLEVACFSMQNAYDGNDSRFVLAGAMDLTFWELAGLILGAWAFIAYGLVLLFRKETAWRVRQWISRRIGIPQNQPPRWWSRYTTRAGLASILFGLLGLMLVLSVLR